MVVQGGTSFEGARTGLVGPNVDALPSKEPRVHRPRARPQHDQTEAKSRQQQMDSRLTRRSKDAPNLKNGSGECRKRRPKTGKQKDSGYDRNNMQGEGGSMW